MTNPKPPFVERRRYRRTSDPAVQGMDEMCAKGPLLLTHFERTYAWKATFDELLEKYVQACKSVDRRESNLRPLAARLTEVARCLKAIHTHIENKPYE
jgi:hypothetical protein